MWVQSRKPIMLIQTVPGIENPIEIWHDRTKKRQTCFLPNQNNIIYYSIIYSKRNTKSNLNYQLLQSTNVLFNSWEILKRLPKEALVVLIIAYWGCAKQSSQVFTASRQWKRRQSYLKESCSSSKPPIWF